MTLPDDEPPLSAPLLDLLRRDEPTPRAIQGAYQRYAARRPHARPALKHLRWLGLGFAAGWGVAFAATGDPLFGAGLRHRVHEAAWEQRATATPVEHRRATTPELEAASASPVNGGATPAPSSTSAHPVASPAVPRGTPPEPSSLDPQWQRAAVALKAHDYDAAETALRDVEVSGIPSDRDAASLALAQVLLTRGRGVEARARLERLSLHASSPVVREQATALLSDTFSSGGRSTGSRAVPQ